MMFCPEDGTRIPPDSYEGGNTLYPPCSLCNTRWIYNGQTGTYTVTNFGGVPQGTCAVCGLPFKSHFRGEVCERKETDKERTEAGWRARHEKGDTK